LWDLSLVDPDNRRPVDFAHRERLLGDLERERAGDRLALAQRLWAAPDDGKVKLYVLTEALALRNRRPNLFRSGDYAPLELRGPNADRLIAFVRTGGPDVLVAVAPRWVAPLLWGSGLGRGLSGTSVLLPRGLERIRLRELYTGRTFSEEVFDAGELLGPFPVALLEGQRE
jgi:(1->4)-alpha-D-glucan 1-alpha-D-glucosylmutase